MFMAKHRHNWVAIKAINLPRINSNSPLSMVRRMLKARSIVSMTIALKMEGVVDNSVLWESIITI
jgi:hypothetical protein